MTDEPQVSTDTSTPDEAQSAVVLEKYQPIGPLGTSETVTEEDVDALPADSEHEAAAEEKSTAGVPPERKSLERPAEPSFWDTSARPPFILSFVESDHRFGGFVVGWDTCGECNLHLRSCQCKQGPRQPKYVRDWRPAEDTEHDKSKPLTADQKAVVTADPQVVDKAVNEALKTTPSGRKKRSDAGQPRGPRKKVPATPDSVQEAADDLSAAMSKET